VIRHLYVHIPFCPKVCPYCSFYKEASDRNKTQAFVDSVLAEARAFAVSGAEIRPETIFFGGGTPTALSTSLLRQVVVGLREVFDLSRVTEWTVEMNPATVSLEKARMLRDHGVNRASMGVQSWDAAVLETLGRVHSAAQARRSYEILRESGFGRINLDLMFGVPGQNLEQWRTSLAETVALDPEHVSAYCLTYEEDTLYFERFREGLYRTDESRDAEFFETAVRELAAAGYEAYEISNYAKPGEECRHNLAYWEGRDYLGLGPSAFSTVGNERWQNVADTAAYIARIRQDGRAANPPEPLDGETRRSERVAFGLRTNRGVAPAELTHRETELSQLRDNGLIALAGGRWKLTPRGRLVADSVAECLL